MKVLLVEPDFALCESITDRLTRDNFVVETCNHGDQALEMMQRFRYDVLVLDLLLPGKSGFEVVSALRSIGNKTPILMTSARTCVEDRIRGLNLGADDFLVKAFSFAELIARIKSLIRRKSSAASNLLRSGDLVVNLSNMQVVRRGIPLALTRKEAGILITLMRNKGKVIAREDLLDAVWGGGAVDLRYSNTLDVHIRTLRQKVDRPYKKKLIRTVRGHGYCVD